MTMTTNELLDAVKAKHSITSDYKLAQHLKLTDAAIAHYRKGRSMLDDRVAMRVADALGVAGEYVLASIHAERAEKAGEDGLALTWRNVAEKFRAAERKAMSYAKAAMLAALAVILSLFVGGGPDGAAMAATGETAPALAAAAVSSGITLCIMSNAGRRALSLGRRWLDTLFPRIVPQVLRLA